MIDFAINKLVVSGDRKDYTVNFKSGINIILGDSDTGKSSILELVNYVLGASSITLYTELESTGRSCYLEVLLGGNVYTLRRELHNPKQWISVFPCPHEEVASYGKPLFLAPNFASNAPDGFLSDFLLKSMGLPTIKIKESPSKSDSKMVRLSFRDMFKYIYLDQDDVGSKGILDQKNYSVRVKNKEVFKFIFDFLDVRITQLQQSISELTQERNRLKTRLEIIQEFLEESNFEHTTAIEEAIADIKLELEGVNEALAELSERMTASTSQYFEIKNDIIKFGDAEDDIRFKVSQSRERVGKYVKLKNDYIQDIDKLKTSQKMASMSSEFEQEIVCPICSNDIKPDEYMKHFEKTNLPIVTDEIKFLNRRKRELIKLINEERVRQEELEVELNEVIESTTNLRILFDTETKDIISPFIQERDGLVTYKSKLREEIKHKKELLQIAKKKTGIVEQISTIEGSLATQTKKLEKQLAEIQSEDVILTELGELLDNYLELVAIKNKHGVAISEATYLPVVRGKDYIDLTSGGLRTIVSIGYFLSILRFNIKNDMSLPPFFMVDTVGKYLSKYTKKEYLKATDLEEDKSEYVEDPEKYKNIYSYMIETVGLAEEQGKSCQIIVVDNDLPPKLYDVLLKDIIVEFNYPKGLIDDA